MLSAKALHLAYGDNKVLNGVDIQVEKGQLLGVIGPNGSGKTSLIHVLSGILKPLSGSIILENKELSEFRDQERARHIAVVPQSAQLPPAFTVFESVALGRTPHLSWLGRMGAHDLDIVQHALQHPAGALDVLARRAAEEREVGAGDELAVLAALDHETARLGHARRGDRRVQVLHEPDVDGVDLIVRAVDDDVRDAARVNGCVGDRARATTGRRSLDRGRGTGRHGLGNHACAFSRTIAAPFPPAAQAVAMP